MRIAISLVWIRHKVAGGVESFTRNLLDGFLSDKSNNSYILLCSKDNIESFKEYEKDSRFVLYECPVVTSSLKDTLFYESFKLDALVTSLNVDFCFVPSFRMPLVRKKNKYIVVIHDLISSNMPQMFKWYRRIWLNTATKRAWKSAEAVITISDFVAKDLTKRFGSIKKQYTIYNPILPSRETTDFNSIKDKYNITKGRYFYTVSSLAKNKNLFTLLKMMKLLSSDSEYKDYKLLISGVGLSKNAKSRFNADLFNRYIKENNLQDRCILTGFVSNEERNTLIVNCKNFLFASIFEGFGMPVVEAMELGSSVITTRCASIPEVSHNMAIYVNNPMDESEWYETIKKHRNEVANTIHFKEYEISYVTKRYLNVFSECIK